MKKLFLISAVVLLFLGTFTSEAYAVEEPFIPCEFNVDCSGVKRRIYQTEVNYVDDNGLWNKSNPVFNIVGVNYEVVDAPFEYALPISINGIATFVPKKRGKDELGTPYQIGDSFIFNRQWLGTRAGVIGTLDGYEVTYSDAFKDFNADLIVTLSPDRVTHVLKIWSKPAKDVEFCFNVDDDSFTIQNEQSFSLAKGKFGVSIPPVRAWTKGEKPKNIEARLYAKETKGGLVTICKALPLAAFEALGEAPYYFDDIFYPDADGGSLADGYMYQTAASWAAARDGAGEGADDSDTGGIARSYRLGANYQVYEGGFVFDTSSISPLVVGSGSLKVKVSDIQNNDNDAQAYIIVSGFAPATNANLVAGDFDSMDYVAYSSTIDLDDLTDEAYISFPLNTAGKSYISTSGQTKFSLLEGHTFENLEVADVGSTGFNFYTADNSGTSSDPYLELELEEAGGGGGGTGTTLSGSLLIATIDCTASGAVMCTHWDINFALDAVQFGMDFVLYTAVILLVGGFLLVLMYALLRGLILWFFRTFLFKR